MKLELKTNFQEKSFIVQPGRTHSRRRQSLPHTERSCLFPHHLPLMQPERWRGQVSCGQDRWAGKRVAGNQHHALVSSLMTHLLDPAERPARETLLCPQRSPLMGTWEPESRERYCFCSLAIQPVKKKKRSVLRTSTQQSSKRGFLWHCLRSVTVNDRHRVKYWFNLECFPEGTACFIITM